MIDKWNLDSVSFGSNIGTIFSGERGGDGNPTDFRIDILSKSEGGHMNIQAQINSDSVASVQVPADCYLGKEFFKKVFKMSLEDKNANIKIKKPYVPNDRDKINIREIGKKLIRENKKKQENGNREGKILLDKIGYKSLPGVEIRESKEPQTSLNMRNIQM